MLEKLDLSNHALLISNPSSGANKKQGLARVEAVANAAAVLHRRIDNMDVLDNVLAESARRGDRFLIINAGDGTVCRVLQFIREKVLFERPPTLVLLRGGTTNMIHNDVGIPGKPDVALRTLLKGLARGDYIFSERHTLRITRDSSNVSCYGFFFATNAVTKAILRTREHFHGRGWTGSVSQLLSVSALAWRLIRHRVQGDPILAPVNLELRRNGGAWQRDNHILLIAISLKNAILGVRPLKYGQRAGLATLSWPEYRPLPWLWHFVQGRLEEFDAVSLRGRFDWILDGETYQHSVSDGALNVYVDEPARFLILR